MQPIISRRVAKFGSSAFGNLFSYWSRLRRCFTQSKSIINRATLAREIYTRPESSCERSLKVSSLDSLKHGWDSRTEKEAKRGDERQTEGRRKWTREREREKRPGDCSLLSDWCRHLENIATYKHAPGQRHVPRLSRGSIVHRPLYRPLFFDELVDFSPRIVPRFDDTDHETAARNLGLD